MQEPQRATIGSIPVLWAEGAKPFTAALLFRVGRADETLVTSGVSHLVEHLALSTIGQKHHAYNAFVDSNRTVFWAAGREEEVCEFLNHVCAALSDLPLDRLGLEARVLSAESMSRPDNYVSSLLGYRYGPAGYGLLGCEEFGLRTMTAETVRAWAAERFTAPNAILWMTGPPPQGLRLSLSEGRGWPPPVPDQQMQGVRTPIYVVNPSPIHGTSLSFVSDRSVVRMMSRSILADRLTQQLRHTLGLVYQIVGDYMPFTSDSAHFAFTLQTTHERAEQVRDEVLVNLRRLARDGPTAAELDHERESRRRALEHPAMANAHLDYLATALLFGEESPPTQEELLQQSEMATRDDVAKSLAADIRSSLVLGPSGVSAPPGYAPYLLWSSDGIVGRPFAARVDPPAKRLRLPRKPPVKREVLYVGEDGISLITARGNLVTVRYDRCVGVIMGADGTRDVWGGDGMRIRVVPAKWEGGAEAVQLIDEALPFDLFVPPPS